jgi:hypothetical protein
MDLGDFPLTGIHLVCDGVALGYGPRRRVLDAILIEAAIASGAEFREGFSVDDYLMDGATVTGIRGRSYESGAHMGEHGSPFERTAGIRLSLVPWVRRCTRIIRPSPAGTSHIGTAPV